VYFHLPPPKNRELMMEKKEKFSGNKNSDKKQHKITFVSEEIR
jgi:hypothetical protein